MGFQVSMFRGFSVTEVCSARCMKPLKRYLITYSIKKSKQELKPKLRQKSSKAQEMTYRKGCQNYRYALKNMQTKILLQITGNSTGLFFIAL